MSSSPLLLLGSDNLAWKNGIGLGENNSEDIVLEWRGVDIKIFNTSRIINLWHELRTQPRGNRQLPVILSTVFSKLVDGTDQQCRTYIDQQYHIRVDGTYEDGLAEYKSSNIPG